MIGVWCLANIGRVLFTIFRPVDSVNEALTRHKDGEGWFIGRLLGGLIVATFWGIFLPIQILWVVYKLSQVKNKLVYFIKIKIWQIALICNFLKSPVFRGILEFLS